MSDDTPAYVIPDKLNLIGAASASTILEAALRYHALGLTVLPKRRGRKDSGLKNWQNLRPSEADLHRFYHTGKYDGVILRPGALSQNLVMIDCDGEQVYTEFCRQFPALADTYTEKSGSGKGYHLFFQVEHLPNPGKSKIACKGLFNTDDLGFEVFYDSSAVVVAPSVHPNSGRYTIHKPLAVLRVGDLDLVVAWAQALETKQDRERAKREAAAPSRPRTTYTGETAPRNGEIAPALIADIERALGVKAYKGDGWSKPIRCVLAHHEHDDIKPAAAWHKDKHIYSCLKCGVTAMLAHDLAAALDLDVSSYYEKPPRNTKPRPTAADVTFETKWISDAGYLLPRQGVVCVIADKGTGKSTWAKQVKDAFGGALVITPLINLTRAAAAHYELELYEGLTTTQRIQTAHSLAITLNSIERFASVTGRSLPRPRLLILDELSKMLAALHSKKLFKLGSATRVFSILGELIRSAELVIVTDADLGEEEIDWLRSLRADVAVAVNTYVRSYGDMDVLPGDQSGLDAIRTAILEALAAKQGAIFVTSTSKAEIEALGAAAQVDYHVLTIHAGNSTNREQRGFIQHPDIALYQGVFVSPSYATGGNIQDRVYRTFGIFRSADIDATLCLQMLARARYPERTVVWVEAKEQKRPIRWETIYNHARQKAEGTEKLCNLNGDGFLDFDGIQKDLLTLQAKLLARRNRSTNNLRADFLARAARNYTITPIEGELPTEGAQAIVQAKQDIKEHWEEAVLTVAPISPEEHQRRSGQGIRADIDNAGLERYLIEHFYKQTITPELFDFDAAGKGRERAKLFIDVFCTSEAHLKELDILEAYDRTPLLNRSHYAQRQRTIRRLLLAVWGARAACTPESELGITDINNRMTAFLEQHAGAFYLYCGGRADHSQEPLKVLQRALHLVGLNLEEIRTRNKDAPKRFRLGRAAWARMNALAQHRQAGLEQEATEREKAAWGALQKNVEKVFPREGDTVLPLSTTFAQAVAERAAGLQPGRAQQVQPV